MNTRTAPSNTALRLAWRQVEGVHHARVRDLSLSVATCALKIDEQLVLGHGWDLWIRGQIVEQGTNPTRAGAQADAEAALFERLRQREERRSRKRELARLRRIETAARAILGSGQARYDVEPIDDGSDCPVGDPDCDAPDDGEWHCHDACEAPVWVGDLVPAAAMIALRAAVEGGSDGAALSEIERLRKAMPSADLLFNAAYLLRGIRDDTCIAMAPSLESAAARILALDGKDDDERALDALIEIVGRA